MAQAPDYNPTTGFATDETNQAAGRSTVKTVSLDTELANISSSINAVNTNLKKLQRDDGKLADGLIEPYALSEQARALIATGGKPRGQWQINTNYVVGDAIQYSKIVYLCVIAHNSGTTFNAGLWLGISGDGSSFQSAQESAASAAQAQALRDATQVLSENAAASAVQASSSANQAGNNAVDAYNAYLAAEAARVAAESSISNSIAQATEAEAEAGTDNSKYMTALRVFQAIAAKALDFANIVVKGNATLGDAGTDITTINSQLVLNGSPGSAGQFPRSRGANLSPEWVTVAVPSPGFSNIQVFTASGTFTVPAGVTKVKATVVGGGGNGGNTASVSNTGGGGGGGAIGIYTVTPSSAITVTVGGAGGTSSFGAFCSATGGTAGANAGVTSTNPIGGVGAGGQLNIQGQGGGGFTWNSGQGGYGGSSIFGGGAPSRYGSLAQSGGAYGGGGGGGNSIVSTSGAGASGVVIVEW